MFSSRLIGPILGCMVINLNMTTCRSPGDAEPTPPPASAPAVSKNVDLPGVDTSDLTPREKSEWSSHVTELLAPCPATPVSVAQCVSEQRDCAACEPAAQFLLTKVKQGMSRSQVAQTYKSRFSPDGVKQIDLQGSPSKGPEDAAVVLVEWADFECPACRAVSPELEIILEKNRDVRFVFKNFPLDVHPNAEAAARAALAADRQGKFWEMHHLLFSAELPLAKERLAELAKNLGLDMAQFDKDMRSEAVADAVRRDRKQGEAVGLRGTPTLYINGREFDFSADFGRELEQWFELERKLAGVKGQTAPAHP